MTSWHYLSPGGDTSFWKRIKGRWRVDTAVRAGRRAIYLFFTCPLCSQINQLSVDVKNNSEKQGRFACLWCKHCRKPLKLWLKGGFYQRWLRLYVELHGRKPRKKKEKKKEGPVISLESNLIKLMEDPVWVYSPTTSATSWSNELDSMSHS